MPKSTKKASSSKTRDYDRESGMSRTRPRVRKDKKEVVEYSVSEDSSSEEEVRVARKAIVRKDFKGDGRRKKYARPSDSESDEVEDSARPQPTSKQTGSANKDAAKDAGTTVAPQFALVSAFDAFGIAQPRHLDLSSFTVNFFMLFHLLNAMQLALRGNTRINNYCSEYFSLGTRIYYAYIGFYQVLRAKIAAGISLDAVERRVYRKLEATLPLESVTIAGPLVGWFQNLGAYHPSDRTLSWVHPELPSFVPGETATAQADSPAFYIPPVPAMIAFLNKLSSAGSQIRRYVNDAGFIIPVSRDATGAAQNFLGHPWTPDATPLHVQLNKLFCRPGLSYALPETIDYLTTARSTYWNRYNLPHVDETQPTDNLERFLFTTGSMEWLRRLRDMAYAESRFFKGSANLSQISPTTASNVTVIGEMESPDECPPIIKPLTKEWCGYTRVPMSFQALSGSVDDTEFKLGGIYQAIITMGEQPLRLFPFNWSGKTQILVGPYFRDHITNAGYTGNLRDRWRKETFSYEDISADLTSLVSQHLYEPMGSDPEPVRIVT